MGMGLKREILYAAGAVLLTRLVMLLALGRLLGGQEFSKDVSIHLRMASAPLRPFIGNGGMDSPMPPLLSLIEAVPNTLLLRLLPEFYAVRGSVILFDVLTVIVLVIALRAWAMPSRGRFRALAVYVALPAVWMTSVVMAQDEVVSALFAAALVWAIGARRPLAAILIAAFGVLSAKIFFVIPLAGLVLLLPWRNFWWRAAIGAAPLVVVYGWVIGAAVRAEGKVPLVDFAPEYNMASGLWALVALYDHIHPSVLRSPTTLAGLALAGALMLYARFTGAAGPGEQLRVTIAGLTAFFIAFYNVNPEYLIIMVPFVLVGFRSWLATVTLFLITSAAWAVNFLWGVKVAASDKVASGRQAFVRLYESVVPFDAGLVHEAVLWASLALALVTAVVLFVQVTGRWRAS